MRVTTRLVDCSFNTVAKLLIEVGRACTKFQDKALRNLACHRLQIDEVWGFVGAKDLNCSPEKKADGWGSAWVWTALCADTKLLATWFIGPRVPQSAYHLLYDLRERLSPDHSVQITTDGFAMYLKPIRSAFMGEADYAQLQKIYGAEPTSSGRYSPAQCMGTRRAVISGNPDPKHISTSYVERHHMTLRMSNRRFTRLTNAFSKKMENFKAAVALHFAYYNFVRMHKSLRMTPAMAGGVTNKIWEVSDLIDAL